MSRSPILIRYTLECDDGEVYRFDVRLDPDTLKQIRPEPVDPPPWTFIYDEERALCGVADSEECCPAALSLLDLTEHCAALLSYTQVTAHVETPERTYVRRTSVQHVLSSLLGLLMATSGCPCLALLKPLARFHLPFATRQENMFRVAGTYFLGEYFRQRNGQETGFDLDGLREAYKRIHFVNLSLARRLRELPGGDANLNALVLLDVFAQGISHAIDRHLQELGPLYEDYIAQSACTHSYGKMAPRPEMGHPHLP